MGPSVKFVLPIIDAFPDKKNGGNFWCGKKGRNGGGWGGSEGVAFFGRKFSRLSFLNTSLNSICIKGWGVCLETPPPAGLELFTSDGSNMTHDDPG